MRNTFVLTIFQQFKLKQFKEDSQLLVRVTCQWLTRLANMLNQTSDTMKQSQEILLFRKLLLYSIRSNSQLPATS